MNNQQAEPLPKPIRPVTARIQHACVALVRAEDSLLALAMLAIMLIPLLEALLRPFNANIPGAAPFTQHLTLIIGMIGGAVAARKGRLLSLSSFSGLFKGHVKTAAQLWNNAIAATISAILCMASLSFALSERTGDKVLELGIPVWVVQLIIPIGFAIIALRLIWWSAPHWIGRIVSIALATIIITVFWKEAIEYEILFKIGIGILVTALIAGAPIFALISGAALLLLWGEGLTVVSVPLKHYSLTTNPTLPAIPLFTLAGYFLAEGGASKRLIEVFNALAGHIRGGAAIITVFVCAFFTSFTGASGVTILALGGLLMPVLIAEKLSERKALGLLTGAGSLGLLLPPCLPLILYAIIASTAIANMGVDVASSAPQVNMERMFLAGVGPSLLLMGLTIAWGMWRPRGDRNNVPTLPSFDAKRATSAVLAAKWELLLPAVALGCLFGGFATPIEAAAITAAYAFTIEVFIYRDLSIRKDLVRVLAECGLLIGGVLMILGVAMGLTYYLISTEVPFKAVAWATEWSATTPHSQLMFLLLLNVFLLVVGCLMDIFSALVVVVPLIVPVGLALGIDPVHLGIIFLANLELGYLTPPVGMNLFLASYRFNKTVPEVSLSVLPLFFVLLVGVLIITYWPGLSTWLPAVLLDTP